MNKTIDMNSKLNEVIEYKDESDKIK